MYICTDCQFKADTSKKIKDQVLFYPYSAQDKQEIYHKDCVLKDAEDKGEHFEIVGKPKQGRMIYA